MGHVIEHIALEIQTLAGRETGLEELAKPKLQEYTTLFLVTLKKM
ncbi:hypothetical protein [Flavobacterium paronense]